MDMDRPSLNLNSNELTSKNQALEMGQYQGTIFKLLGGANSSGVCVFKKPRLLNIFG